MKFPFLLFSLLSVFLFTSCATINDTYEHFKTKEVKVINPYDQYRFDINDTSISDGVADDKYLEEFKKISCVKIKQIDCLEKYKGMFKARLKLKYKEADLDTISLYCVGYPVECNNNKNLEQIYILSNNFKVTQIEKQEKARLKAQQEADTQAALAGLAGALAQHQERLNQQQDTINQQNFIREQVNSMKRTTCTTNAWGNSLTTNCN